MASVRVWQAATLTFATTSVVLAVALFAGRSRTETVARVANTSSVVGVAGPRDTPPRERERVRVASPTHADPTSDEATDEEGADDAEPVWTAAIAPDRDLRDILAAHVFAGLGMRAPRDVFLQRVRQDDPARAARVLEDWIRRTDELKAGGLLPTGSPPDLLCTYAALCGRDAIPLLRAIDKTTAGSIDWMVELPLVAAGDEVAWQRVDHAQRSATGGSFLSPRQVLQTESTAVDLVRSWTHDDVTNPLLREEAVRALFSGGAETDRERLWTTEPTDARLRLLFAPGAAQWEGRLRKLAEDSLADPDPWIRVHAAARLKWANDPPALVRQIAETDATLPCPDGRDRDRWAEMCAEIGRWLQLRELVEEQARERHAQKALLGDK